MKKLLIVVIALVLVGSAIAIAASSASAYDEHAAIWISDPDGCFWHFWVDGQYYYAYGRYWSVITHNGQWQLTCRTTNYSGPPVDSAIVLISSPENPLGTCHGLKKYGAGDTQKWHIVINPSGISHFSCQGDATP